MKYRTVIHDTMKRWVTACRSLCDTINQIIKEQGFCSLITFLCFVVIKFIYNFCKFAFFFINYIIHLPIDVVKGLNSSRNNSFFYQNSITHKTITKLSIVCLYTLCVCTILMFYFQNEYAEMIISILFAFTSGIVINFIYYSKSTFVDRMEMDRVAMSCMDLFVMMNDIFESIQKLNKFDNKIKRQIQDAYVSADSYFSIIIYTKPELVTYFKHSKEILLTMLIAADKEIIPDNLSELSRFHMFFSGENKELLKGLNQLDSQFPYFDDEEFYERYKELSQEYIRDKKIDEVISLSKSR